MSQATYILGSSPRELSRLSLQDRIIRRTTERLLEEAGISEGMRVLDLGCGAGDVSMLVAEMVGPLGTVVGIDRSQAAIDAAESRARDRGFQQIEFHLSTVDEFSSDVPFDLVIGRLVLIHQPVPSDFIRAASRHVRPGGVLAFHEVSSHREFHSLPESPLFEKMSRLVTRAVSVGFASCDAAGRMVEHFQNAGLPQPRLFAEMSIGGGSDASLFIWLAETIRSLIPVIVDHGLATEEEISIDTLGERLISEMIETQSQIESPAQVCAWTRV